MRKKSIVVGCGAVGSILAAHLASLEGEVFVADAAGSIVDAVGKDGLDLSGTLERRARVAGTFPSLREARGVDPDYVFVCVKTTALARLAPELSNFEESRSLVVSVQNGIDTEEELAAHFPRGRVLRVVVNFAGVVLRPGAVKVTFFHPPNFIGSLAPEGAAAAGEVAGLLTEAGLKTVSSESVKKAVWHKAILNSCIMPVSVLTGLTMKRLMELPGLRELVKRLIRDFTAVARAEGHVFEDDFMDQAMRYLSGAGDHKPSMLVDFEEGRPLEIDFLNGSIQRYADRHGVACETNRMLLALVEGLLRGRQG